MLENNQIPCDGYQNEIPIEQDESVFCEILSILKAKFIQNDLLLSFSNNNQSLLENELANIGLTISEATDLLNVIDYITIELAYSYEENGIKKYGNVEKTLVDPDFLNLNQWVLLFENIPTEQFYGELSFELSVPLEYSENGEIFCARRKLNFFQETVPAICSISAEMKAEVQNDNITIKFENFSQQVFNNFLSSYTDIRVEINVQYFNSSGILNSITIESAPITSPVALWKMEIEDIFVNGIPASNLNLLLTGRILATSLTGENVTCAELENDIPVSKKPKVSLPEYTCGQTFAYQNPSNQTKLVSLSSGDVVNSYGFPIEITEVSSSIDGVFGGKGIVPLPFDDKYLQVTFKNITVNTDFIVLTGSFKGVQGDLSNYPSIQPQIIDIGGEICLPPPPPDGFDSEGYSTTTGLNAYGFNREGIHAGTGTKWDPNGFDKDGNFINGGNYTPDGCKQDGTHYLTGKPCDPSAWKNSDAENFTKKIENELLTDIQKIIDELKIEKNDSLTAQIPLCNNIRIEMDNLMQILQYEEKYIFGESEKYFASGLSKKFKSRPEETVVNFGGDIERDENTIKLENKHVELYDCDVIETRLKDYLTTLNSLSNDDLLAIKTLIVQKIMFLDQATIKSFNENNTLFINWLIEQVKMIIPDYIEQYTINYYKKSKSEKINNKIDYYNSLASNSNEDFDGLFSEENKKKRLDFLFNNGFTEIDGVSRGVYLNEIAKYKMTILGGGGSGSGQPVEDLMPIVIVNGGEGSGVKYWVMLDQIEIFPNSPAILNAYLVLEDIGKAGQNLVFESLNVLFTPTGLISGSGRIALKTEVEIRLNNAMKLIIPESQNFVEWNCEGFQRFHFEAQVEICREYITPIDNQTLEPLDPDKRYTFTIEANFTEWIQTVVTVSSTTPFAITGAEDIKWRIGELKIDLSDKVSPDFAIPSEYVSPFVNNSNPNNGTIGNEWKGVYLKGLTAIFPKSWTSDPNDEISVEIEAAIIDGDGFTGSIVAQNILDIKRGSLGGWGFSIDQLSILFVKNNIKGGGFGGQIKLPIMDEDLLRYEAKVSKDQYLFAIKPPKGPVKCNLFLADLILDDNCAVFAEYRDHHFNAKAVLNGKLNILPELVKNSKDTNGESDSKFSVELPQVTFTKFELGTEYNSSLDKNELKFSQGEWRVSGSSAKFNNFEINVTNVKPVKWKDDNAADYAEGNIELLFELGMSLQVTKKDSISADGAFGLRGRKVQGTNVHKLEFVGLQFYKFQIEGSFPGVKKLFGLIQKFNGSNSTTQIAGQSVNYGRGYRGLVEIQLSKLNATFSAVGQFGHIDEGNYKYFFVDILADLGMGIPLAPIPLKINGFGGGISNNMERIFDYNNINWSADITTPPIEIGRSFSGTVYIPNKAINISLQATAMIAATKEDAFNGMVSLGFSFHDGGGLDKIQLYGIGKFMELPSNNPKSYGDLSTAEKEPPFPSKKPSPAKITAYFNLDLDFGSKEEGTTTVFTGHLAVFMDARLGNDLIRIYGSGSDCKAVDAALKFSKDEWYIYIGTPTNRAGLIAKVGSIIDAELSAYIDIGTSLPSFPDLDDNVKELVGNLSMSEGLRNSGAGFMFGGKFTTTFTMNAIVVSAKATASVGFDLMMRKYTDVSCIGWSGNLGINGWYATGQMWAYLRGKLEAFGITIIDAGVAALFQAQFPNPFWMRAAFGVKYKNIWGKEKVLNVKVEAGQKCIMNGSIAAQLGMEVIASTDPYDNNTDFSLAAKPTVYLTVPLEKSFEIELGGSKKKFMAKYLTAKLELIGRGDLSIKINKLDDYTYEIQPFSMLPPNDSLLLTLEVEIYINDIKEFTEEKLIKFYTGDLVDIIPENNIKSAYPYNGMVNFYPEEFVANKGFIDLEMSQAYLFYDRPANTIPKIRLTSANGAVNYIEYEYISNENRISYDLNPTILNLNTLYKLEIVNFPQNPVNPDAETPEENIVYTSYFRTSKFKNVIEKVANILSGPTSIDYIKIDGPPSISLLKKLVEDEPFDYIEQNGFENGEKILTFYANINSSTWFSDYENFMYSQLDNFYFDVDAVNKNKILESIFIKSDSENKTVLIDKSNFLSGYSFNSFNQFVYFDCPKYVYKDYKIVSEGSKQWYKVEVWGVADELCNAHSSNSGAYNNCMQSQLENLMKSEGATIKNFLTEYNGKLKAFKQIEKGNYQVIVGYKLPDGTQTTYTTVNFTY